MSEEEREEFLESFRDDGESLLGLCVLGGIFSEGIDLQGESLIGSIIVGTGIPMVCDENEIIKDYFDAHDGDGMKYAYIFPGFNKVLQAAGRVIRTHEDVGIVALLDYRFSYRSYRELFPREWQNIKRITLDDAPDILGRFWDERL
jgi:Rad3-related DNA helicase